MHADTRSRAIFITLATVIVYSNTFEASYHYDDISIIWGKLGIENFWNTLRGFPYNTRFVGDLSFAVNYALDGYNIWGYHLANILLHLCTALALFWLVQLMFITPAGLNDRNNPNSPLIAFFTALLFAVHPAHTQAVTYIIQRYTLLAALFYFFTLAFYIKSRLGERKRGLFYLLSLFSAILAVYSKPNTFTLPLALLAVEIILFKSSVRQRGRLMRLIPFAVLALSVPVRLFAADILHETQEVVVSVSESIRVAGDWQNFLAHFHTILYYIKFTIWPAGLAIVHDFPVIDTVFHPAVVASYIILGLILLLVYKTVNSHAVFSFGLLLFLVTPMVELYWPDKVLFYDHWLYLASSGLILSIVYGAFTLVTNSRVSLKAIGTVLMILAILLAATAFNRNVLWKTERSIWQDAVEKSPTSVRVLVNLGQTLITEGDVTEGCRFTSKAYKLYPNDYGALLGMGGCRREMDDGPGAEKFFKMAIIINPNNQLAHILLRKLNE